jgi:uncharacterized membrane protein YqjE
MNVQRTSYEGASQDAADATLADLVRRLTRQGSHLAEQQVNLVQAEVREGIAGLKASVASLLGAAVVGMAGLGVLLMGLSYLFGQAIDNTGLATVIVGIITLVAAFILYGAARTKISAADLSPDRARRTLERTPDAIRGNLHSEHQA